MKKNITCKQAVDFISKAEEGRISLMERVQLKWHMVTCYLCRYFRQQNNIMTTALKKEAGNKSTERLTDEEKSRLIDTLEKENG